MMKSWKNVCKTGNIDYYNDQIEDRIVAMKELGPPTLPPRRLPETPIGALYICQIRFNLSKI